MRLNLLFPTHYAEKCQYCEHHEGTLRHVQSASCLSDLPPVHICASSQEQWEKLLSSSRFPDQIVLVERMDVAKKAHGFP
ncbi:hypothetical protein HPB52_019586 [Rhipicephalus sanguineus]|uniref:Uncharacterized protein n=1 Tax=Rhipicephalus sanguineus TaxID=34632 RepID=A0A9D4T1E4_RHISA|nr:hypothetical protein HPB52_019586 [Rhipicephalus sanguineus]